MNPEPKAETSWGLASLTNKTSVPPASVRLKTDAIFWHVSFPNALRRLDSFKPPDQRSGS